MQPFSSNFNKKASYFFYCFIAVITACKPNEKLIKISDAEILLQNQDILTQVIVHDIFSPPVVTRIYAYTSLASYEAMRYDKKGMNSIAEQLNGFGTMPQPEHGKDYNFTLAATKAFFKVTRNIKVFSVDSLDAHEEMVYNNFKKTLDNPTYLRSMAFGDTIANVILARAREDGYIQSRGKPKHLGSNHPGKWRPTPPNYQDGVEWCWNEMKPMALVSASQFMPPRPPKFSKDTASLFYKETNEVYFVSKNLNEEQKNIAKFWDDNPFVVESFGHLMFGTKKITPGCHWMGIAAIAAKQTKSDPVKISEGFALTAIALYDAFIACWDEKYRSNVIRPVTVINEKIDPYFSPFLQTPPFPEYVSGHSTISASASVVLTHLYGDNFAFQDTSGLGYIGMQRHFTSFQEAASEAAISRLYGGIHFRSGIEAGLDQGKKVGGFVIERALKNDSH